MKVIVIGANQRVGTSAKTGRPYDISEVQFLVPDEDASKNDEDGKLLWDYRAHGFRVQTIKLNPSALDQFKNVKLPGLIDLHTEPEPANPARNWVIGINS